MEMINTESNSQYDEYKNLILQRDELNKKAFQYQEEYYREFGNLMKELFSLKVECICLKKKISYCQMCINQNKTILASSLNEHISIVMKEYNEELNELVEHIKYANNVTTISLSDVQKIKKIYRYIVKKIHPDMNPELFKRDEIKELWKRTSVAYTCNNLKELQEIQILVDALDTSGTHVQIENISQKIDELKKEIDKIIHSTPYEYKYLLDDSIEVHHKKSELKKEIEEYIAYKKQLETLLSQYDIKEYQS